MASLEGSNFRRLTRYKAFGIHLLISAGVLVFLVGVIALIWYPGELIELGGWQGIKIVAGVDLVLGPLLTLIVFDAAKKELKRDLLIIALIQISALCYGSWVVYQGRPVAQILSFDGLNILTSRELGFYRELSTFDPDGWYSNKDLPLNIYLSIPVDQLEAAAAFAESQLNGLPITLNTKLYDVYGNGITGELSKLMGPFNVHEAEGCVLVPIQPQLLTSKSACLNIEDGSYVLMDAPRK